MTYKMHYVHFTISCEIQLYYCLDRRVHLEESTLHMFHTHPTTKS